MSDACLPIIAFIVVIFVGSVAWIGGAHFESKAYNRITGAQTTTWDAMFLELRVQDSPKN